MGPQWRFLFWGFLLDMVPFFTMQNSIFHCGSLLPFWEFLEIVEKFCCLKLFWLFLYIMCYPEFLRWSSASLPSGQCPPVPFFLGPVLFLDHKETKVQGSSTSWLKMSIIVCFGWNIYFTALQWWGATRIYKNAMLLVFLLSFEVDVVWCPVL